MLQSAKNSFRGVIKSMMKYKKEENEAQNDLCYFDQILNLIQNYTNNLQVQKKIDYYLLFNQSKFTQDQIEQLILLLIQRLIFQRQGNLIKDQKLSYQYFTNILETQIISKKYSPNLIMLALLIYIKKLNTKIFECGQIARKSYIILKGEVFVLAPGKNFDHNQQKISFEEFKSYIKKTTQILFILTYLSDLHQRLLYKGANQDIQEIQRIRQLQNLQPRIFQLIFILFAFQNMSVIDVKKKGDIFGEKSLLEVNGQRQLTVIVKTECQLAVINKEIFDKTLSSQFKQQENNQNSYLSKIPLFQNLCFNSIKKMINFTKHKLMLPRDVILQKDQNIDYIYIILNGQISAQIENKIDIYLSEKQFIGEELILKKKCKYTYICTEKGKLLQVDIKSIIESILSEEEIKLIQQQSKIIDLKRMEIRTNLDNIQFNQKKCKSTKKLNKNSIAEEFQINHQIQNKIEDLANNNQVQKLKDMFKNNKNADKYNLLVNRLVHVSKQGKISKKKLEIKNFDSYCETKLKQDKGQHIMLKNKLNSISTEKQKKKINHQMNFSVQQRVLAVTHYQDVCNYFDKIDNDQCDVRRFNTKTTSLQKSFNIKKDKGYYIKRSFAGKSQIQNKMFNSLSVASNII